jgi:hypothetical protein
MHGGLHQRRQRRDQHHILVRGGGAAGPANDRAALQQGQTYVQPKVFPDDF